MTVLRYLYRRLRGIRRSDEIHNEISEESYMSFVTTP